MPLPRSIAFGLLVACTLALIFGLSAGAVSAHEFWIEPERYVLEAGEPVVGDLKVGEAFEGSARPYLPQRFRRFDIVSGDVTRQVEGRTGDRPALSSAAAGPGLNVVVHETGAYSLTYDDWATFRRFLDHKDALWVADAHAERGLPEAGVTETYARYAKSLVAVAGAEGADRPLGLEVEIVALANPYLAAGSLPVRILYRGKPRAGGQLEVFDRAPGGSVQVTRLVADADGVVSVPLTPRHEYLLDHVVLRERADGTTMWESLWASLTFAVPDQANGSSG